MISAAASGEAGMISAAVSGQDHGWPTMWFFGRRRLMTAPHWQQPSSCLRALKVCWSVTPLLQSWPRSTSPWSLLLLMMSRRCRSCSMHTRSSHSSARTAHHTLVSTAVCAKLREALCVADTCCWAQGNGRLQQRVVILILQCHNICECIWAHLTHSRHCVVCTLICGCRGCDVGARPEGAPAGPHD